MTGRPDHEAPRILRPWFIIGLGHAVIAGWSFSGALFAGRLLFFRDLFSAYAPNYEVLARGFAAGVWPLWNSACDAGGPFLIVYPLDLLLVLVGGSRAPLGWGAGLHLVLALFGASALARRLGMGTAAAWAAGAAYGLGGFTLSLVNLLQLFQAAAWAPWVLWAWLGLLARPSWRRTALLAAAGSLQVSTLGGEVVVQTALAGLVLTRDWRWTRDRRLLHLGAAVTLAALVTAPAWEGTRAVLENTARGRGFSLEASLAYSLAPITMGEAVVPRLLGDVHAFSASDFWGEPFFPQGYPYLLSLYVGMGVLVLAIRAGARWRLLIMGLLGVFLSLGAHGPAGALLARTLPMFRGPQKFFFLTALAVALLAGFGLDRARQERTSLLHLPLLALPGLALFALWLALVRRPDAVFGLATVWFADLAEPAARASAFGLWSREWLSAASLAFAVALVLARGGRWAALAGPLAAADLAIVNGPLNQVTSPAFYDLRPAMRTLVAEAAAQGTFRWFTYGAGNTPGLLWEPAVAARRSDRSLYAAERQALWPRTHVFDGLDSAFDVDVAGWAPEGATLEVWEVSPTRHRELHPRLRLANVRWVLSFRPLPPDLADLHGQVKLEEIIDPLMLFELRDPLPRAFWVPDHEAIADRRSVVQRLAAPDFDARRTVLLASPPPAVGPALPEATVEPRVRYEPLDPHTVRIEATTPPGFVVVLDGYNRDWEAAEGGGRVPVLEADGRYRALRTPGGSHSWTLRYRPRWRTRALLTCVLGLAMTALLAVWPRSRMESYPPPTPR